MKSIFCKAISVMWCIVALFICCKVPTNPLENPANTKLHLFSAKDTVVEVNVAHRIAVAFALPMHVKTLHLKSSCEDFDTTVSISSDQVYDTLYFNPVFTSVGICTLIATAEMVDESQKDRTDSLVMHVQSPAYSLAFTSIPDNYVTSVGRMDTLFFAVSRTGITDNTNFSLFSQPSLDSNQLFLLTSKSSDTARVVFAPVNADSVSILVYANAGTFRDSATVNVRVYKSLGFICTDVPDSIVKGKSDTLVFVVDNSSRPDSIRIDLTGNMLRILLTRSVTVLIP